MTPNTTRGIRTSTTDYPRRWHRGRFRRWSLLKVMLSAIIAAPLSTAGLVGAQASAASITCRDVAVGGRPGIPVSLSPGRPRTYRVRGQLCEPRGRPPRTVQLLLHGATYTADYWDWPDEKDRYSYVRRAVAEGGYATLSIDRIGHGRSSRPASSLIDTAANVTTVHEIIQDLRDGTIGRRYQDVITVGHSYGSVVAMQEAADNGDVNAVILTGLTHVVSSAGIAALSHDLHPARSDALRFTQLDPGYLTTLPDSRGDIFYRAGMADPTVVARDEATKDTVTSAELGTFGATLSNDSAARIRVPVMLVVGEDDGFVCGTGGTDCSSAASLMKQESGYFRRKYLHTYVVPEAGHDINLQKNARTWYSAAVAFADRYVGPNGNSSSIERTY